MYIREAKNNNKRTSLLEDFGRWVHKGIFFNAKENNNNNKNVVVGVDVGVIVCFILFTLTFY